MEPYVVKSNYYHYAESRRKISTFTVRFPLDWKEAGSPLLIHAITKISLRTVKNFIFITLNLS